MTFQSPPFSGGMTNLDSQIRKKVNKTMNYHIRRISGSVWGAS